MSNPVLQFGRFSSKLSRASPDTRLVTFEIDGTHYAVGRSRAEKKGPESVPALFLLIEAKTLARNHAAETYASDALQTIRSTEPGFGSDEDKISLARRVEEELAAALAMDDPAASMTAFSEKTGCRGSFKLLEAFRERWRPAAAVGHDAVLRAAQAMEAEFVNENPWCVPDMEELNAVSEVEAAPDAPAPSPM